MPSVASLEGVNVISRPGNVLERKRAFAFVLSFLLTSLTCLSAACGERVYSLPIRLRQVEARTEPSGPSWSINARRLIREDKCEEAWRLVWPVSRHGNHDATRFIAEGLLGGLQIPSPRDQSKVRRNQDMLHFFAYGSLSDREANLGARVSTRDLMATASALILSLDQSPASKEAAGCFDAGGSPASCLALAREAGILRNFGEFGREYDHSMKGSFRPGCSVDFSPPRIPAN